MSTPPDLGPLPAEILALSAAHPQMALAVELPDLCEAERQRCYMLGVAAEREACAKVCDVTPPYPFRPSIEAAHAIRQRARTSAPSAPTKEGG